MITILTVSGWIIFFSGVSCLGYTFYNEVQWQKRNSINFHNFEKKVLHFDYKASFNNYIFAVLYVAVCVIFLISINETKQLDVMAYFTYFGIIMVVLANYLNISRQTKNQDIVEISTIYMEIKLSYENLDNIKQKLESFANLRREVCQNNELIEQQYEKILKKSQPMCLTETLKELDDFILQCTDIVEGFDKGLSDKFAQVLKSFLKNEKLNNIYVHTKNVVDKSVEHFTEEIISQQKEVLSDYVTQVIIDRNYKDNKALLQLIEITFIQLQCDLSEIALESLMKILDKDLEVRASIIESLRAVKQVSGDNLCKFVVNDSYDWLLFVVPIQVFSIENHIEIAQYIINENKESLVLEYLIKYDDKIRVCIGSVLGNISTVNKTRECFINYQTMLDISTKIEYSPAVKAENLLNIIKTYNDNYDYEGGFEQINEIQMTSSNLNNFENILSEAYQSILKSHHQLWQLSFKLKFIWINSKNNNSVLDKKNVLQIADELQRNLQIDDLVILNRLICAFLLSQNEETAVKKMIMSALEELNQISAIEVKIVDSSYSQTSTNIITRLVSGDDRSITINLVNRIEKNRMLMGKLDNYRSGVWQ